MPLIEPESLDTMVLSGNQFKTGNTINWRLWSLFSFKKPLECNLFNSHRVFFNGYKILYNPKSIDKGTNKISFWLKNREVKNVHI